MSSFYIGNGSNGALTVSSTVSEDSVKSNITTQANSGQKDIVLNSATSFAPGDWALIIQMQGTGAGQYEFDMINSISSNTLTMKSNLSYTYQATGAQVVKMAQYSSVTINSGGTWTASSWNGTKGGVLAAMVSGNVTISSGGSITVNSIGFRGGGGAFSYGWATQGESPTGAGSAATSANGSGGGGGKTDGPPPASGAGGGGAGHGAVGSTGSTDNGTGGTGGSTDGSATLQTDMVSGAGGGGGSSGQVAGEIGAGGNGGGIIILIVGGDISVSANISSNGANGTGSTDWPGGGGGGSGGSVRFIATGTIALGTGYVVASAGSGGASYSSASNGGAGAVGRIATLSGTSVSGTSDPAINTSSTDTITSTDPYGLSQLLDDNILFQESISKNPNLKPLTQQSYSTTTGSSIKKITAETVGLSELNETRSGITRSLLESMGLLESKDSEWEIKSNFSEDLWTTMFLRRFTIETFFDYDTKILLTETLRFSVIKQLTDPLVLAEALAKKTDFKLEDALALVELFERTLEFRRSLTESISLTELNQRILQLQKIMIELIDLTVLIQKSGQLTLDDSLTLIESLSKKSDLRNLLENVDLVDSKLFDLRKNLGSLVSFAEELSSMTGLSLTETLLLLESFITISDSRIQLTDTSALAETLSKQSKIPFSSMLSLVESIYIGSLLVKELSDIIYVGRTAGSLSFDGIDNYASCDSASAVQPANFISVETWVKHSVPTRMALSKEFSINGTSYSIDPFNTDMRFLMQLTSGLKAVTSGVNTGNGVWRHVVGTYDGSFLRIYVDGVLKGTPTAATGAIAYGVNKPLRFGTFSGLPMFYDGKISEVRIYDRVLSATEVAEHKLGIYNNETGLLGYWRMNEGTGDRVTDSSGNGNHATIYKATWDSDGPLAKENLLKLIDVRKQASLPISEIIQPIVGFEKTEQISFSETFVKETRKQNIESIQFDYSFLFDETHDLSDVLILTEHLSTQSSRKDVLQLLSIAASIKKEITIPRDDVLIITESKIKDFDRPLSESFDLSDLMTKESGKVLIDNLLLTEFLDTIRDFNLTEIITLAESLVKDVDLKQSEIISLIESLRTLTSKELTESLSLVEMISQKTDLNLHDSLSLFETLVKEVGRTRQDSILFTEILSKRAQQRLDDDVNLSDQINTTAVYFLDFVDSFSLIETLTRIHGLSLSDAFTLVESMSISETEPLGRKTLLFTKGQKTILISK